MTTTLTHPTTITGGRPDLAIDAILRKALYADTAQFELSPHDLVPTSQLTSFWLGNTLYFHLSPNNNHTQRQGSAQSLAQARQVLTNMLDGTVYCSF